MRTINFYIHVCIFVHVYIHIYLLFTEKIYRLIVYKIKFIKYLQIILLNEIKIIKILFIKGEDLFRDEVY